MVIWGWIEDLKVHVGCFTECKGAIEKTREALDNVFFKSFSSNGSNSPFLRKEETKINHSTTLVFINAIQRRESEGREDNMWQEKKNKNNGDLMQEK